MRKHLEAMYNCKIWQDRKGYHVDIEGTEVAVFKYMKEVENYLNDRKKDNKQ